MPIKRETVILVDDDSTNLVIGKNSLSDKYDVLTAPSGKKMFNIMEKVSPDLILLDIDMPEMNGYEVLKTLKETEKTSQIPVVLLSARMDPVSAAEGFKLGAADYMIKPYTKEMLIKRVSYHICTKPAKKRELSYNAAG